MHTFCIPLTKSFFLSNVAWNLNAGCFNAASGSEGDMYIGRPLRGSRSRLIADLASA